MSHRARLTLLLIATILVDAALLQLLTMAIDTGILTNRLLSLAAGVTAALLLGRILPVSPVKPRPGLVPLIGVSLILNYGIFAALAARTPGVQPLAHLAAAWLGTVAFGGFGLYRIRRWRD